MTRNKGIMVVPFERITHSIFILRGHKVLLDADLAALYGRPHQSAVAGGKTQLETIPG